MDRAFQRIRSLMLRGTFYSVPPMFLQNPKNDLDSKKQPPYFMSKVMAVILSDCL